MPVLPAPPCFNFILTWCGRFPQRGGPRERRAAAQERAGSPAIYLRFAMSFAPVVQTLRNPGPSWGYNLLRRIDGLLPDALLNPLVGLGAWVAVAVLPKQRGYSRAYLSTMFGRRAHLREVWRHFFTYVQVMMIRIRTAEGSAHDCVPRMGGEGFRELMSSNRPALLGTFHFGNSDLLGFLLGTFRRHVHMIRLRVDNSRDTQRLSSRFGPWVTFVWVNQAENLLFALKDAAQSGGSLAMMCDRIEHSSKVEAFHFLGTRRLMPFTIYHLSLVFRMPVAFCLSVPGAANQSLVHASPVFEPDNASKEANLERARSHFQAFLHQLESLLRANPYLWFNVLPASQVFTATAPERHSRRPGTPRLEVGPSSA
jgi:predicted LPLAT superfamily acyltransferase